MLTSQKSNICPECGSVMSSRGLYWFCKNCGRWRVKNYRGKKRVTREITCPDCGGHHIISKGLYWLCTDCGRSFKKQYRIKQVCFNSSVVDY